MMAVVLLLGAAPLTMAEGGFYADLSYVSNNPGSGFNGDTYFTDSVYRVGKPALQSGGGFAVTAGIYAEIVALELTYANSSHSGSCHVGGYHWDGTANLNVLDLNMKLFLDPESSVKPYGLFGLSFPWVNLPGAEHNTSDVATGDATYWGFGLNLGGGVDFKLAERFHIKGEVIYRWAGYGSAYGSNMGSGSLPDFVDGSGVNITIGAQYTIVKFE
jgi:hypothetical protein